MKMLDLFRGISERFAKDSYEPHKKGREGEKAAGVYLSKLGYRIIAENYRTRFGEIDIVAEDEDCLVFIEIKMRESAEFLHPSENVGYKKQRRIIKSAEIYIMRNGINGKKCRFDVVSVIGSGKGANIELVKDAFQVEEGYWS